MPETTPKASAAIFDPLPPFFVPFRPPFDLDLHTAWVEVLIWNHAPVPWNPGFWREVSSGR